MADMRTAGHAIRRRSGASSSHLDAAGVGARVNLPTPEEALAGMARIGSPRVPMGNSAITDFAHAPAVPPLRGTLTPKGGAQAGDPTPPTGVRGQVMQESLGASYRIKAVTPPMMSPEAGPTTANGKVVPSSLKRQDSFGDGASGAYAGY
jgi:hypothetical protein